MPNKQYKKKLNTQKPFNLPTAAKRPVTRTSLAASRQVVRLAGCLPIVTKKQKQPALKPLKQS